MKHPDLINEFPNASDETKVRHFWKQLKKEDDLHLSLLSWISIFIGFMLVMVAILGAAWLDLNPIPVTLTFGGVCSVVLWRKWLWRALVKAWGWIKREW
jgi:hypothetical protein